jgi:hypothetical protein
MVGAPFLTGSPKDTTGRASDAGLSTEMRCSSNEPTAVAERNLPARIGRPTTVARDSELTDQLGLQRDQEPDEHLPIP